MANKDNTKLEGDIEEIQKQIWLLTLKIKNLKESSNKIKKAIETGTDTDSNIGDQIPAKKPGQTQGGKKLSKKLT